MTNNVRFPAEWEPQAAILIAWPNADTDWAERLVVYRPPVGQAADATTA